MWNLSTRTIEHIGVSYAQNAMVEGLVIRDNWGKTYYELYPQKDASVVSRTQDIYAEDQFVGSVEISISSRTNQEIRTQYLMVGVFTLLINLVMLLVTTGFLLRIYLQRPLQQLSAIVNTYIAGNYESAIQKTDYDEFQSFVQVLNDMGKQITAQLHELEGHRRRLEKLVEQRTAELSQANIDLKAEITERKQVEEQIKDSLREKEVLLQEIHHRVKNNLAIVSSLLSFQAEITPDEQARAAFQESQNRIHAMARIHEHLYRSPDLARIDMAQYVRGVTNHLIRSYGAHAIAFQTDVSDVELDIDRATPCGLIINELVSNALKHAFPPGWQGPESGPKVRVALRLDDGQCELTVSDNGVGLPADLQVESAGHESLGLRLVNLLNRQLKGNLQVDREGGSTFCLTFAIPEKRKHSDGE
ncbi:MAG: histidine kinase dimerization/phosphoacceptor domain -containing protein [Anaerolineae bacterium]